MSLAPWVVRGVGVWVRHQVVFAANEALDLDPQLSLEVLADRVGLTPETLGRKLRGWSAADLDEILGWADEVGVDVLPVIQSDADLLDDAARELGVVLTAGVSISSKDSIRHWRARVSQWWSPALK